MRRVAGKKKKAGGGIKSDSIIYTPGKLIEKDFQIFNNLMQFDLVIFTSVGLELHQTQDGAEISAHSRDHASLQRRSFH